MNSNDENLRRLSPQNVEAEQAVIGAVLIDNRQFEPVAELLQAEDFYREAHRVLWRGIEALAAAKRPIDAITLTEAIRPHLEAIGGPGYIAELVGDTLTPPLAVDYARMVREKAIQRGIATFGAELSSRAYESPSQWSPDYTEEMLASAEYDLAALTARIERKPEPRKAETLATVLYRLEHRIETAVPTGFDTLDRIFGGFGIGHLTILAARTSRGKTAFALNVAINTARAGYATLFFALEQPADELWSRAIACVARVDMFAARLRGLRDGEREEVEAARAQLQELPLEILYRPAMRPRDLRLECRRVSREMGQPKLVVVDYLGLMRGSHRERERWREMQEIVFALKEIAGELGIPILLLSQLNRDADEKVPPSLSNLRDTGAAEEHSSNVLMLWQPPQPAREANAAPVYGDWEGIEVIVAKQRNGPAGYHQPMEFRKDWGAFRCR